MKKDEKILPVFLLDNGHGQETPGKRSPDGSFLEWEWTRRAAAMLRERLAAAGIPAKLLVPETRDVPLYERIRRVNAECALHPCVLVSIHVNAAGDGSRWLKARGWSVYVANKASQDSCRLARKLYMEGQVAGFHGNRSVPDELLLRANFYMLRHSQCPAVLTENLFMDNREDVAVLKSDAGIQRLVSVHYRAICDFLGRPV